jgi:hypothetical protein
MSTVINMASLVSLIVWMQVTVALCILTKSMGTLSPKWLIVMYEHLNNMSGIIRNMYKNEPNIKVVHDFDGDLYRWH